MNTKTRYWLNLFLATVFSLGIAISGLVLFLSYRQAQAYLRPARSVASGELLEANNIEYHEIELNTQDGVTLSAWYTVPENGAVILLAHGYGDKRSEDFYALFATHGYGVLAWDFRAHGKSGGEFSTLGYYERLDVEAALDYALAQPGVEHVGAWGGSMGGATVILTAAYRPEIEAVVIDSAFPTLEEVYEINVPQPFLQPPIRFFAEWETGVSINEVRPVDEIGKISPRAVFIIQGNADSLAAIHAAERLYDAAGDPKQVWTEEGVPHLNMYAYYRQRYTKRVIKFFDEYVLGE
jgi:fermentation-respiration switch protein FrsA (DUF1100 family)